MNEPVSSEMRSKTRMNRIYNISQEHTRLDDFSQMNNTNNQCVQTPAYTNDKVAGHNPDDHISSININSNSNSNFTAPLVNSDKQPAQQSAQPPQAFDGATSLSKSNKKLKMAV